VRCFTIFAATLICVGLISQADSLAQETTAFDERGIDAAAIKRLFRKK